MDEFQKYLLERINFYQEAVDREREECTVSNAEIKAKFIWGLENSLSELVGAFSEYEVNYKV